MLLYYKAIITPATICRFVVYDFIFIIRRGVLVNGVFAVLLWQLFIILILFNFLKLYIFEIQGEVKVAVHMIIRRAFNSESC